jgi:hypothetical protein
MNTLAESYISFPKGMILQILLKIYIVTLVSKISKLIQQRYGQGEVVTLLKNITGGVTITLEIKHIDNSN